MHQYKLTALKAVKTFTRRKIALCFLILFFASCNPDPYHDVSFYSEAFKSDRMYRIYLPPNYDANLDTRYPVVYYFHGWGGRYKWDSYDVEDDIHYPGNGRKEPPFVMEWKNFVKNNDVIIVTWDGYEPNLHPGKNEREEITYGNASPYDYVRAHEKEDHHWGWDYRMYFRDLVSHVDANFRTIADRDHRAISGLSMGGLTAYYVAGQNRDLISSVSAFDPADNIPLYGPKGHQAVFPILEMYRPLKGLSIRLTMTDGDWLKYNDWKMKGVFEAADVPHFEFHLADYPDHWSADADQQLDFHMREFQKSHPLPDDWSHVCPGFPAFESRNYHISVKRTEPALTIMENVSIGDLKILSRKFLPDGPIVADEKITISTDSIYSPNTSYKLTTYNLLSEEVKSQEVNASADGKLVFELGGGGHAVGINGPGSDTGAKLKIIPDHNQEYFYFEAGKRHGLDFKLVNVGTEEAKDIVITVSSNRPEINFLNNKIQVPNVDAGGIVDLEKQFNFTLTEFSDSTYAGSMVFDVKANGKPSRNYRIMVFAMAEAPYIDDADVIILDGQTVKDVPVYKQGPNIVETQTISGGTGNGNGILEAGEAALVYIRLPKGMGPNDINTFHRTYLVNHADVPYISVEQLNYEEKLRQAGSTSLSTVLEVSNDIPDNYELDLCFQVESLYNEPNDQLSKATIYSNKSDYRRIKLKVDNVK